MGKQSAMQRIFDNAIRQIKPEQEIFREADDKIAEINSLLKKNNINAECMAGGSYAKGTILKDDFDIDLFVRFGYEYKSKESQEISILLGKALAPLKPILVHGSRDYYQIKCKFKKKSLLFEIIPVLMIDNYKEAVNVTDMSPLHVGYAHSHFEKNSGMADQVRLAKQFCKAAGIYGAESYIRGFSGHVLDMLIIFYGSFEQLLIQASLWGSRVIIDIEKHLKDPLKQLNKSKTQSPLIIVDPVQPDRNAAAAVSREKFEIFKKKAREFILKPKIEFFQVKKLDLKELEFNSKCENLILLKAKPLDGNEDVVGAKVLKCFEHIESHLKGNDFKILSSGWEFGIDESFLYYIIKKEKMSDTVMLQGPPVKQKKDAERFRQKHKKIIAKDNRLFCEEKRKYKAPEQLVKHLLKEAYVKERVKKIKML